MKALVDPLKQQVKDRGLWALFLDEDLGGPGFGQLKLALLNEILGQYGSAPVIFGTQGPDTGNMEILAAYGTAEQKERWLYPLMNQEIWSAFSMTEPQGGSDPSLFKTEAVRDGDEWVINGEKWFTSFGEDADIILVMCSNGIFIVEQGTPGHRVVARRRRARARPLQRRARPTRPPPRTGGRWPHAGTTSPRWWPYPPRHAHGRRVQEGHRHDVRARAVT